LQGPREKWEKREIGFQRFESLNLEARKHVSKIAIFCRKVRLYGLRWAWVDTCCIEKASSAELGEAINSMFRWYKNAEICCVYLDDVVWHPLRKEESSDDFRRSKWFTRGWTLQELLAPTSVMFYDKDWECFGYKETLAEDISQATGINTQYLRNPERASVAIKMSWATNRQTSRIEDTAYCLLGLFDINMPMVYGEGGKVFLRLQLEIIKSTDDELIFAWVDDRYELPKGMLAPNPAAFASSGDIVRTSNRAVERPPYSMTNKGLELHIGLTSNHGKRVFHPHQALIFSSCKV
jgi:Heterokaryon incompatibility protein (HET)